MIWVISLSGSFRDLCHLVMGPLVMGRFVMGQFVCESLFSRNFDTPTNPGERNPGDDKPWTRQTLDKIEQGRDSAMYCTLRLCETVH
jgi:hypothetical protein